MNYYQTGSILKQRVELEGVEGHDPRVGFLHQRLDRAGGLGVSQARLGGGDAALGAHDGRAGLLVQQEVDQHGGLGGVLAGLGDGQAHRHLGEAAVVIAELDLVADGEAVAVVGVQGVAVLDGGGIPLQDAGDLAGDPLGGLAGGGGAVVAVILGQRHDHMAVHQALDEVQALGHFLTGIVQGGGSGVGPVLSVDGLQIGHHQDHPVVAGHVQQVVVVAQGSWGNRSGRPC